MNKIYYRLLILIFLLLINSYAWTQKLNQGDFVSKIDGININYTIKGQGPVETL